MGILLSDNEHEQANKAAWRMTMKTVTPTAENVSWDHSGCITVDGLFVAKVDDDCCVYDDIEGLEAHCDIDELKEAVALLISQSDAECDYINENVAAWASK